jgi:SOS-response transcriptional repressor LexA
MDGMTTTASHSAVAQGIETRKQIVRFIRDYWRKNKTAPSLTEISTGVGLASHSAVRTHLLELRNQGNVTWVQGKMRTVRVVEKPKRK